MENEKLISVVIPCYNHEKYIEKTVRSVLQQTYPNIEVLVADDCSTDNSVAVLQTIQDARLKLFPFQRNQGTVFTLNFLLKQAKGDYIATLGSDDYFAPDKLEKQLNVMERDPALGAVFSWAEIVDGNDIPHDKSSSFPIDVFQEDNKSSAEWIRHFFLNGNHLCHSSAMVRRSVQDDVGLYRPAYRQLHDYDYWFRVLCKYPIYVIPEKLTAYRRADEDSSISASKSQATATRLYNETNSVFYALFREMPPELFVQAFSDMLYGPITDDDSSLEIEKYLILRQLSAGGRVVRNAAHMFFAEYITEDMLTRIPEQERLALLKLYYEDTAQDGFVYPNMAEILAAQAGIEPPGISIKAAACELLSAVKRRIKKQLHLN